MRKTVVVCGKLFDGLSDTMHGPAEILIEGDTISEVSKSVGRPDGAKVVDLSERERPKRRQPQGRKYRRAGEGRTAP